VRDLKCIIVKKLPNLSIIKRRILTETELDPVYVNADIEVLDDTEIKFENQFDDVSAFV
jgi:hypothetical protein